jgi:hypothetical protein
VVCHEDCPAAIAAFDHAFVVVNPELPQQADAFDLGSCMIARKHARTSVNGTLDHSASNRLNDSFGPGVSLAATEERAESSHWPSRNSVACVPELPFSGEHGTAAESTPKTNLCRFLSKTFWSLVSRTLAE